MGLVSVTGDSESRFRIYVEALTVALGHADRAKPVRSYCTGLLLPGARKSVEPMAARLEPGRATKRLAMKAETFQVTSSDRQCRSLAVEAIGDFSRGKIIPRIRIAGQW